MRVRRREGLSQARASVCRMSCIGPPPKMVQRSAQSAMRNSDHGLSALADRVSPGGKRPFWVEELLGQGSGQKPGEHPRSRGRPLPRRQAVQVEERFETLEQQFDLPAQAIEFEDLDSAEAVGGRGGEDPDDLTGSGTGGNDAHRYPILGLGQRPSLVAPRVPIRGNRERQLPLMAPQRRNLRRLALQIDPAALQVAQAQRLWIETDHDIGLRGTHPGDPPGRSINAVTQHHFASSKPLPVEPFTAVHVGQLDRLQAARRGIDLNMRAPFRSLRPRSVDDGGIDDAQGQSTTGFGNPLVQNSRQQLGELSLGLAKPIKQPRPGDLRYRHRPRPGRHVLQ
jgi:hypothetical protein